MSLRKLLQQDQSGFMLILTLIQGMAAMSILTGVMGLAMYNLGAAKRAVNSTSATYVAEAGADRFMFEVNKDNTYTGTNTVCPIGSSGSNPVTLYSNATGRATYETCVKDGTIPKEKIVYSVGKIYVPAASTTPKAIKTVRLVIVGTPFNTYTFKTGPGGVVMSNSATITSGPVYIGGFLDMSNTARIGSSASPVDVSVANMRCPVPRDATWPQVCPMGTQNDPISISNSARIYGDVKANGQVTNSGLSSPGLTASSGVAGVTLPDYDRAAQKAAVSNTLTGNQASCTSSQTKTWPANLKITGDVTLDHSCSITVTGDVWITGNLTLTNTSQLVAGSSLVSRPTIMIDGPTGVTLQNQTVIATNSNGVGLDFITFYSVAGCSPDCSSVTGNDLYNSMNVNTVNLNNQGLAANSSFYARWSGLILGNGGNLGIILAQKMTLTNSGNITFGGGESVFTTTYTWDVRYYETL